MLHLFRPKYLDWVLPSFLLAGPCREQLNPRTSSIPARNNKTTQNNLHSNLYNKNLPQRLQTCLGCCCFSAAVLVRELLPHSETALQLTLLGRRLFFFFRSSYSLLCTYGVAIDMYFSPISRNFLPLPPDRATVQVTVQRCPQLQTEYIDTEFPRNVGLCEKQNKKN